MTIDVERIEKSTKTTENKILSFLRTHRRIRNLAFCGLIVLSPLLGGAVAYICVLVWLPELWSWGFNPITWRAIFAVLGSVYLLFIPYLPIALSISWISNLAGIYAKEAEDRIRQQVDAVMTGQDELERSLQADDSFGLVKLIRYSRLQLQAYYQIGLSQSQRSFRYSIVAMWVGFFVIVLSVIGYMIPKEILNYTPPNKAHELAFLGGLIIEIISAVFLWVYKSSISQLTYFYERLHQNHNALIAFTIADSMDDKDSAKLLIVEQLVAPINFLKSGLIKEK